MKAISLYFVVVGTRNKVVLAGSYQLQTALIIGRSWAEPTFVFYEREEGPYAENGLERVFSDSPRVLDAVLAFLLEPTAGPSRSGAWGRRRSR
jgi:hypothetical protein